ncbi:MAG: SDR family NAD(P)-dependent oxidoreductase [Deltaproteobacteria bacterium]|nr:SDR family NAD(P)-dependent oxidoreductase [Deltaproteobacteria bacterium]
MERFDGKIAVITGGGTGMGRELARQLAAEGCHIAMCDVSAENMAATKALCERENRSVRVTTQVADVSSEAQIVAFRDAVVREHATRCVHLVFANAGIGGGGSFVSDAREEWDKTFAVCWNGVYFTARAFVPLLVAAPEGWLVNTASVNGFWASLGPKSAHSAYSAAKFAVKGFSEALINDFKVNAPHVGVSVVMPGHIGTAIAKNSAKVLGRDPKELSEQQLLDARARMTRAGLPVATLSAEQLRLAMIAMGDAFENDAPTTASQAAKIILDGVRAKKWRILVGHDAHVLDRLVREAPEDAYGEAFMQKLAAEANWKLGT